MFCLRAATSLATHRWHLEAVLIEGLHCWLLTSHPDGECLPAWSHFSALGYVTLFHQGPPGCRIRPRTGCGNGVLCPLVQSVPFFTVHGQITPPWVPLSHTIRDCKLDKWMNALAWCLLLEVTTQGNNKVSSSIQLPRFKSQLWNNVILVNRLITPSDGASFIKQF